MNNDLNNLPTDNQNNNLNQAPSPQQTVQQPINTPQPTYTPPVNNEPINNSFESPKPSGKKPNIIIIGIIAIVVIAGLIFGVNAVLGNKDNNTDNGNNNNTNTNNKGGNSSITINKDYYYSVKPIGRTFGQMSDGMRFGKDVIQLHGSGSFKNSDEFKSKNIAEQTTAIRIEAKINGTVLTAYSGGQGSGMYGDANQFSGDTVEFTYRIEVPWKYQFENATIDVEVFLFNKSVEKFKINSQNDVKKLDNEITELNTNKVSIAGNELTYKAMISKSYPVTNSGWIDRTPSIPKEKRAQYLIVLFEASNTENGYEIATGADYVMVYKDKSDFKTYREVYPNWLSYRITSSGSWTSFSNANSPKEDKPKYFVVKAELGTEDYSNIKEVDLYITTVDNTYKMTLPVEYMVD